MQCLIAAATLVLRRHRWTFLSQKGLSCPCSVLALTIRPPILELTDILTRLSGTQYCSCCKTKFNVSQPDSETSTRWSSTRSWSRWRTAGRTQASSTSSSPTSVAANSSHTSATPAGRSINHMYHWFTVSGCALAHREPKSPKGI